MPKGLNIPETDIVNMKNRANPSFIWVPYNKGKTNGAVDVSSRGSGAYRKLSTFSHNKSYQIPVPGMEDIRADSVEGIWQGLKIFNGVPDFLMLRGKPKKRKGKPQGHLFGEYVLDYVDARKQIYVPAYAYHVINNALDPVKEDLEARVSTSGPVALFDVESNSTINDTSQPYSHAALLVRLLNFLEKSPLPPFNKKHFTYLHEQVDALLEHRSQLNSDELELCDDVITFAYLFSPDELTATFALRAMKDGNIDDKGRLKKYTPTAKTREPYLALRR
ncbi:hypothetical protein GF343_03015 [Candidatus Woesearchaeota archaeon]|nr:hypothetical protein [Candidatus Woesearchaeota archaeon]